MTFTRSNANFTGTIVLLSPSFVAPAALVMTVVLFFVVLRAYIMAIQLCTFRCVGCDVVSAQASSGTQVLHGSGQGQPC